MAVTKLVILGAGGFGREVLDIVEAINASTDRPSFTVLGFLDDGAPDPATIAPYGIDHLGPIGELSAMGEDVGYVIGIGSPRVRRQLDAQYRARPCPTLIHPAATIGKAVAIGDGSVICAGVRLTNNIRLGRHVHVNINCTVGHDARLDDYVTVSPLTAISGYVHCAEEVMLGTGVTVNPGVTIGARSVLGSGAVALRDISADVTAVGVPARPR